MAPKRLRSVRDAVVIIGDTLVEANSPRAATERTVAQADGATFIDPTPWFCPGQTCPAVMGRLLVFRGTHHMTAIYARSLAPVLDARLPIRR